VLNGRNEEKLRHTVSDLAAEGLSVRGYAFDVTDSAQVDRAVSNLEQELDPVDILVNNAGIQRRAPLETFEEPVWREVIDTNLTSVFLVTKRVVQRMIQRRAGKIINIGSLSSEISRVTVAPLPLKAA
jgi:gluconate 5-dehydrogenase